MPPTTSSVQHRVHFLDAFLTPSPAPATSTLPPSVEPLIPSSSLLSSLPPKYRINSPSRPLKRPSGAQIHPVLTYTPGFGALLSWDLRLSPEQALVRSSSLAPTPLSAQLLSSPACTPPTPALAIQCSYLPWTLSVTPPADGSRAHAAVTVGDVLSALYRILRLGVASAELDEARPWVDVQRVRATCEARCAAVAHAGLREAERAKGVKRVDFLGDARMFRGFSVVSASDVKGRRSKRTALVDGPVWQLHVKRP
ncbi:hypothetical protein C8Q79DRAFT_919739 [Trametes meyenii]|nr:hypothetical protein C8Q79DRAFT_919739 [Trametes meyenii]